MNDVYRQLREKLDKMPVGLPESSDAYEILMTMFAEDEAALALKLPLLATPLEDVAAGLGMETGEAKKLLDRMAQKGTVMTVERKGRELYRLLPSVVGFSETPYWSGKMDERAAKLSPVWKKYFDEKFSREIADRKQQIMRVVPVDVSLSPKSRVADFEHLVSMLEPVKYFAVAHCPCRQHAKADGKGCDHLTEACFHFDSMGQYIVEHGMGRRISREETVDLLRKCNEDGLVHMTENYRGRITTICNCCSCCCLFFRAARITGLDGGFTRSNYVCSVDAGLCTACGTCAERCPVEAIDVNEYALVDGAVCIGCGVCYPSCPQEAIHLEARPEAETAPVPEMMEWVNAMLREKATL